jgi:hypothetical protein
MSLARASVCFSPQEVAASTTTTRSRLSKSSESRWGNPARFGQGYFPEDLGGNLYLAGDGVVRDKETDYFTITGRIDDVLNVSGHRLGTVEMESALVANPMVTEAAVVGRPDETTGEVIVAFVVLKGSAFRQRSSGKDRERVARLVGKEIGPIAKPKEIRFGENLPKTRCAACYPSLERARRSRRTCRHSRIRRFLVSPSERADVASRGQGNSSKRHGKPSGADNEQCSDSNATSESEAARPRRD